MPAGRSHQSLEVRIGVLERLGQADSDVIARLSDRVSLLEEEQDRRNHEATEKRLKAVKVPKKGSSSGWQESSNNEGHEGNEDRECVGCAKLRTRLGKEEVEKEKLLKRISELEKMKAEKGIKIRRLEASTTLLSQKHASLEDAIERLTDMVSH